MESTSFCGQVCHQTMEPEYVGHQAWPHARVSCTSCHVGPGAGAFVEAKLAGTRQLFQVMTNRVPKPVPPPGDLIQTARETCEGCHWPETFRGDKVRVMRDYANDEANTESTTTLRLHIGGGSPRLGVGTGIHWHMNLNNQIDFVAAGPGEDVIPYVRLTSAGGETREYFAEGVTAQAIAGRPTQRMDCMDCHNRPAHTFFFTPERAIDTAIAQGRLPRELPFVRREAVAAVSADYDSRDAALDGDRQPAHRVLHLTRRRRCRARPARRRRDTRGLVDQHLPGHERALGDLPEPHRPRRYARLFPLPRRQGLCRQG